MLFSQSFARLRLGLGTMMMGWRLGESEAIEIFASARDHGIRFVDTSVSYGRGECHTIVGRCVRSLRARDDFYIATKVGGVSNDADPPSNRGYHGANLVRQCDLALRQLGIDSIDLLQLHHPCTDVPVGELVATLAGLKDAGKIGAFGVCNYPLGLLSQFEAAAGTGEATIANQVEINLFETTYLRELRKERRRRPTIAWGPLSSGLLTSRVAAAGSVAEGSRIDVGRERQSKQLLLKQEATQQILQFLWRHEERSGVSVARTALAWVMAQPEITGVLIGPSSLYQFREFMDAPAFRLAPAVLEELGRIAFVHSGD